MAPGVLLRPIEPADIAQLFEHQREPEGNAMAAFPARDRAAHDAHWAKILSDPQVITRAIVAEGRVAGQIGSWLQGEDRQVGYWVGRAFWGRGVASEALALFLTVDRSRPLHAHVGEHNGASRRVLEKCGFVKVGEEKGVSLFGGPPVDEVILQLR